MSRTHSTKRTSSSANGTVVTGRPHAKEWNWLITQTPKKKKSQQNNYLMFKDLKIHLESVKLLEENMGWEATLIFCVRDDFIDATAKWWVTKIKIHDYDIKQSLFIAKEASHRREVSQLSEGHVGKPHVRGRIVLKNCRYSFFNSMFLN